jgi:integrase
MGCWTKGRMKNGQTQDVPLPSHYTPWLEAWTAIRLCPITATRPTSTQRDSLYLFPGRGWQQPLSAHYVKLRWKQLREELGINGLWNYDLRRTLVCNLGNELGYDAPTIRAIINHTDGTTLGHYYFKSFDSLCKPIEAYADWLCALPEGGTTMPVSEPAPPPVEVSAIMAVPRPIVRASRPIEREEWPG